MNFKIRSLYLATSLLLCAQIIHTLDIVVTSEADSGPGTLREAIEDINSGSAAPYTITFALNVKTISLISPLPAINSPVTISGFASTATCSKISPVDNAKTFSAAINITIDGSNIPSTGSSPVTGLTICSDDVIIRGIRIANFSNTDSAQVAGIVTQGKNTEIECCEITNLTGNNADTLATVTGIYEINNGAAPTTTVLRCFVHNLNTINHTATTATTTTGNIIGIGTCATASDCRVECLTSGSITYTNSIDAGTNNISLTSGSVTGIHSRSNLDELCNTFKTKQCVSPFDCEGSECPLCEGSECVVIENCLISCCATGAITATKSSNVLIQSATGIAVDGSIFTEVVIDSCNISTIETGSALLSDETFSLLLRETFGIQIAGQKRSVIIIDNTVSEIHRGIVELGGVNSSAELFWAAGIVGNVPIIFAENNSISHVTCQKVVASGLCTTIRDTVFPAPTPQTCIGRFANPFFIENPVCAGMFFIAGTTVLCGNSISNIDAGKRIATGKNALIMSKASVGLLTINGLALTVSQNTIRNTFGAELMAGRGAAGIFGGDGTKGVVAYLFNVSETAPITIERNNIKKICEQTLHAPDSVPSGYIFLENLDNDLREALKPSAQTTGISVRLDQRSNTIPNNISIQNNVIADIAGAIVKGETSKRGTIAAGISLETTSSDDPAGTEQPEADCSLLSHRSEPSIIQYNTIKNVFAGTKNTAYGILLDGTSSTLRAIEFSDTPTPLFFNVNHNTIANLTGFGTPQPFETTLIEPGSCGTNDPQTITFVPFPYQPSSGIYTIFGNCINITSNTITNVTEAGSNARGITTQASNHTDITKNIISKINGYGIFVAGATADCHFFNASNALLSEEVFEDLFASTRNQIYSNSIFDNTKQGIELGLVNWNNYFEASDAQCSGPTTRSLENTGSIPEELVTIYGNHNQPAPRVCAVTCNRNGTMTIEFVFDSSDQPFTQFIIQFFANQTNTPPHGKQHISNFDDPACIFKTDAHGHAKKSITFVPVALVNSNDVVSAHVTVATANQGITTPRTTHGDTSEFGVVINNNLCPNIVSTQLYEKNQKTGWLSFLKR